MRWTTAIGWDHRPIESVFVAATSTAMLCRVLHRLSDASNKAHGGAGIVEHHSSRFSFLSFSLFRRLVPLQRVVFFTRTGSDEIVCVGAFSQKSVPPTSSQTQVQISISD